jgi:hypothetical protein
MNGEMKVGAVVTTLLLTAGLSFGQVSGMYNGSVGSRPATYTANSNTRQQAGPGTINYTEGQVTVDGQALAQHTSGTTLQAGQTIDTSANGYVEVLLTPGAFLRIGNNSEVRLVNAGLVNTDVQLTHGEALVEVDDLIKNSNLVVNVGNATTQLEKKGLYDFNANQPMVRVLDGKAKVTEAATSKTIGKDDQLALSGEPLKKTDFDAKLVKTEPLYTWSQARSQYESQANLSAANYVLANGGWYGPGWYWDPYWSFYAFVPGAGFLYSPFGWGFYSPGFIYSYGPYFGYRVPFGYRGVYRTGAAAAVRPATAFHSGFVGSGFRGGFAGGFHGGRR